MKKAGLFLLLVFLFLGTTGASIIDKETKDGVLKLDASFKQFSATLSQLSSEQQKYHQEELRYRQEEQKLRQQDMKDLREATQSLTRRLNALEKKIVEERTNETSAEALPTPTPQLAPVAAPAEPSVPVPAVPPTPPVSAVAAELPPETPAHVENTEPAPPTPMPSVEEKPATHEEQVPQVAIASSKPPSQNHPTLAVTLAGAALFLSVILIIRMRSSEERLKKILWKSEIETLREEVTRGRPLIKILTEGGKIELVNTGETTAEDIKLFIGSSPGTLKQKLKTVTRMQAAEKVEVNLQTSLVDGQNFANLEYRGRNNGKIYKDQFLLQVDRLTGQLTPVAHA